jgi:hypothetical protein
MGIEFIRVLMDTGISNGIIELFTGTVPEKVISDQGFLLREGQQEGLERSQGDLARVQGGLERSQGDLEQAQGDQGDQEREQGDQERQ